MKKFSLSIMALMLAAFFSAGTAFSQPAVKKAAPSVTFNRVWADYDVKEDGKDGMRIHADFTANGMKGVDSYLAIYFQKRDGTYLMDNNNSFNSKQGKVAVFKAMKPGFEPTVYEDLSVFMPYDELDLTAGKYALKMDVDVIYEDGTLIQHLTYYDFDFTQPGKTAPPVKTEPSATFQKIWVDYGVTEDGKLGMTIHTAFKLYGMKGVDSYLQIKFQKSDGTPLMDKNGEFEHEDGSVAAFGTLKPGFEPTLYEDFDVFMPYSELELPSGKHNLKMDVDVVYKDGGLVQHLTYYAFEYTKP